jgi:hypothetical protein
MLQKSGSGSLPTVLLYATNKNTVYDFFVVKYSMGMIANAPDVCA